jgi:hypothetical protein
MAIVLDGTAGITSPAETIQGNLTTTGNTILGDASTDTLNVGNGGLVKDASGNVGVGTASPTVKLDVNGSARLIGTSTSSVSLGFGPQDGVTGWSIGNGIIDNTHTFRVYDNTAGTTRMTIDSSGNVGIGVTPSAWTSYKALQIGPFAAYADSTTGNIDLSSNRYSASGDKYIGTGYATMLRQVDGTFKFFTAPSGTAGNAITFTQAMTLQTGTYGGQQLLLNTTAVGNAGSSVLYTGSRFTTAVIPYAQDAFGCIRIQDTSGGSFFSSEWGIISNFAGQAFTTISYSSGMYLVAGNNGTNAKIYFDGSGNAYKSSGAGSWLALSDSRIKTNVQSVTNGLARILQLNPVTFDYKSPEAHNNKVHDKGFIADDYMTVYPDSVTETDFVADEDKKYIESGTKAKAMGFNAEFYADLVAAIQEQQAMIDELKAKVAALEAA